MRTFGTGAITLRLGLVAAFGLGMACPGWALTHRKFDFVVGVDGDFKAMAAAAAKKATTSYRYYVFFPDGNYDIGSLVGDSNQKSTFSVANVSMIGQSADKTVVYNKAINEGIGITATLYLYNADDLYMQDMTVMNKANYGQTSTYSVTGRYVAIQEQSDRMIYKNVKQLSTQDTYYTKGTRTYWEGGQIDGTTDFICGGGDVYFNGVALNELKAGSPITASASNSTWGYVFQGCTIDAVSAGYLLGRSWDGAKVVYLNSIMKTLPSSAAWGDPMNSVPKVFAEYNSKTSAGATVDLSKRRTSYTLSGTTVTLNPVLTAAQAATYTVSAVLAGTDSWKPDELCKQLIAPVVSLSGTTLKWDDNTSALCWAVFKNGTYWGNTATNSWDASSAVKGDVLTVRAANSMGGLGASSAAITVGTVGVVPEPSRSAGRMVQTGRILSWEGADRPVEVVTIHAASGAEVARVVPKGESLDLSTLHLPSGLYVARALSGSGTLFTGFVRLL
jgi:pectin methylesterase-like acyl-CoA thioesterase